MEINDEGTTNKWNANPIQVLVGLVTRAQAKKFEETLNGLIQNIWVEINSWKPKEDPMILVPKKDGTWRMCVDFQAVNKT